MMNRPVQVLIIADSPSDARLTMEALMAGPVSKRISVAPDMAKAVDLLRRRGEFARAPRPDIVLLHLDADSDRGFELLQEIKSDPALQTITVIVLSTSSLPAHVNRAYGLLANCYLVKPAAAGEFDSMMRRVEDFWMSNLISLPTGGRDPLAWLAEDEIGRRGGEPPKRGSAGAHARARRRMLPLRARGAVRVYGRPFPRAMTIGRM